MTEKLIRFILWIPLLTLWIILSPLCVYFVITDAISRRARDAKMKAEKK